MGSETDSMVERVAKAIAAADERNGGPPYEYRISLGKHAKEQLFDEARAAIEAMRYSEDGSNCPEAVRIAGEEAYAENGDARAIFNAMIVKALEE